jgi:phage-related protein (TIGR01555 family)
MIKLIKRIFPSLRESKADVFSPQPDGKKPFVSALDPLDYRHRSGGWSSEDKKDGPTFKLKTVEDFPFKEVSNELQTVTRGGRAMQNGELRTMAMDGKLVTYAMDDCNGGPGCGSMGTDMSLNAYTVPEQLMSWYASQSFIGYQACAIIAQHWLVDKACSMAGEDAIRNGWEVKARGDEAALTDEQLQQIKDMDKKFNLMEEMKELNRFKNVFGIRVLLFKVESDDPKYYEKPFNIDGVAPGSYKGISQVDPYWMMPMMTAESTADPSSPHFYDPEFWVISGVRYHRSHLIIVRGPEPADLLKPTYIFGGIPLTQRIYERVYAAERTANEAPLLAMNKRTTTIHVDMEKAVADQDAFTAKILMWQKYRDNHAVKILGEEEAMEQFDTSLSDFDSVIMNQYQLVAAIAKTPATKLLGTSPKGFNATGEHETISYHEELESIQQHVMSPFLTRHYELLVKSLDFKVELLHVWEPVDSITMAARAQLNKDKAELGKTLIDGGVISPDEERNRIRDDKHSGYNRLQDDDAETEPGMSPEALVKFEKVDADKEKAEAAQMTAGARVEAVQPGDEEVDSTVPFGRRSIPTQPGAVSPAATDNGAILSTLQGLAKGLAALEDRLLPEGHNGIVGLDISAMPRSTKPSTSPSTNGSTAGQSNIVGKMPGYKLPKLKIGDMTVAVENPRGTIRQGMDIDGNGWSQKMPHHYGYIRGTKGADDEEMDCFIGHNMDSQRVFVINQNGLDGKFDEHKCMIGFDSADQAKEAYANSFSKDWKGFDSIVPMSMGQFRTWIKDGDCYSPLSASYIAKTTSTPAMAGKPTGPADEASDQESNQLKD